MVFDPFAKNWEPIEQNTIVSVRCTSIFNDDKVRRGRVYGWHIATGHDPERRDPFEEAKPILEYEIKFFRTQTRHWVPVKDITGFLKRVQG